MKRPYVIAILAEKGGAGKSTIATNLAWALSEEQSTLLVDADPQQTALDWSDLSEEGPPTVKIGEGSVSDIPRIASDYEYVVLDGAPRLTDLTQQAARTANLVIVPVHPSAADIWSSEAIVDLCERYGTRVVFCISRGIVGSTLTDSAREALETFDVPVLEGTRQRVSYVRSLNSGSSVLESGDDAAAEEIRSLKDEVLKYIDR
ncbi:chromosome partitioning protein [Salinibacter ruber]|uniref:AAA family ATPase n=1 Tax=Salinibacter ruber TaxID=146919 RepID=UPI002167D36C|nr:AAA family ATPase [Salinibacter ruber]MCS3827417.1 chromosome partitioning protein [Salinibacter ruber]